ncbi:hypothetical protein OS493_026495 [Desmophyllum pertusum]|uniref:Uncharacterized protein n=1 Tax=Desmophyllum pertusum TaxID=174260 RepID=A0A9W9YNZ7_9CNID|nr:hypothetical protein OS493_026495 [Desmophyllum pertusum]
MSTRGAIPKKFSRNVLLLKNGDFPRINDRVYMPTASEISKIKHGVQLGQFKRKVEFDASMSEDRIKKKLEETFPYLVNRRFSCAAVVKVDKDSSRFEFHGSPHPWSGKTIRSKIKGNSALYILENAALNSETETSTSIPQGDNDDMNCLATDVNQMSDSSEEILSSFDNNATSSGIGGEFSEEEYSCMAQWVQNNVDYEVCINPQESPLQGGAPCCFSFYPELQPEVTSGHAKFGYAAPVHVELERLRNGSLLGTIPASQVPGWVPVIIESQDGTYLGQTEIKYHGDQMEEALQQIVVDPSLQKRFFEKYKLYYSSGGNLETSGGETQNSGTPGSVQMLSLLVYAAAESGAQQFIEMIFTASAGRVVYDAYKDRPLLPEVIAKKYGNEKTANYLQEITKRFSEEIRTGQECSHIIDWSELVKAAEAAQKQLGLTSEENYQLESDVSKETGYLGDAETSSSESSDLQSSDSDDDISTTFRKGNIMIS